MHTYLRSRYLECTEKEFKINFGYTTNSKINISIMICLFFVQIFFTFCQKHIFIELLNIDTHSKCG